MINHKEIDLKKEISELEKMKGLERGSDYKYLVSHVLKNEGPAKLKKIKTELKKLGFDLPEAKEVDNLDWLPLYLSNIFIAATVKVLQWSEEDIKKMGRDSIPGSPLIKFFVRHFLSVETTILKATETAWKEHYSVGTIKLEKYDQEKKQIIVRVENMPWHPYICLYHIGALGAIAELIIGRKVEGRETKCPHKGDDYHQFTFNWQ